MITENMLQEDIEGTHNSVPSEVTKMDSEIVKDRDSESGRDSLGYVMIVYLTFMGLILVSAAVFLFPEIGEPLLYTILTGIVIGFTWTTLYEKISKKFHVGNFFKLGLKNITLSMTSIPEPIKEYYKFLMLYENKLPSRLSVFLPTLKNDIVNVKDSLPYASAAFLEKDFINALGKLKVIVKDENYFERFESNFENAHPLVEETIYQPIEKACLNYINRRNEYEGVIVSTKDNNLYNLLLQDFTEMEDVKQESK